jgi:hypothetical protein
MPPFWSTAGPLAAFIVRQTHARIVSWVAARGPCCNGRQNKRALARPQLDVRSWPPPRQALPAQDLLVDVAVAGLGQTLRGDPWVDRRWSLPQIIDLAQGARGDHPYGERAELVQLVRAAKDARSLNE